jgi:uncharacterized protein YmfQ (DUF2313 family)
MPANGGASPGFERYGGGENGTNIPLLQRVYMSIAQQRGSAYDQSWPPATIVGMENMAIARAITFDGYGANQRLANNFIPTKASLATGMLQRWERIFGLAPLSTDTEPTRRARVAAAWQRISASNALQPITDQLTAALGPLFVKITHQTPATALTYWPAGATNAGTPWYSTIYHVLVQTTQNVAGYSNADGSPNAAFYAAVGAIGPIMEQMLPAWCTWNLFIQSSHGANEFRFDEHNFDIEVLT